jgi:hypothetical protein
MKMDAVTVRREKCFHTSVVFFCHEQEGGSLLWSSAGKLCILAGISHLPLNFKVWDYITFLLLMVVWLFDRVTQIRILCE